MQSTLIEFDLDLNIINDLATCHTVNNDSTIFNFTIRKDTNFTDGSKVTSKTVKFTLYKPMAPFYIPYQQQGL